MGGGRGGRGGEGRGRRGGIARLELNYCLPGSVQPGDGWVEGERGREGKEGRDSKAGAELLSAGKCAARRRVGGGRGRGRGRGGGGGIARLELNYCLLGSVQPGDGWVEGGGEGGGGEGEGRDSKAGAELLSAGKCTAGRRVGGGRGRGRGRGRGGEG